MAEKTIHGGRGTSPPVSEKDPLAAQRAARRLTPEQQMRINQQLMDAVGKGDIRKARDAVEGGADSATKKAAEQLARRKYAKYEQELFSAANPQQGAAREMPAFTRVETPGYVVCERGRDAEALREKRDTFKILLDLLGGKGQ